MHARPTHSLWRIGPLRNLAILAVLAFTSFFLTLSALPLWAAIGGAPVESAGAVTTVMLACTIVVQLLVPALARRFGSGPVLAAGLLLLGAPAPLYLLDQQLWWSLAVSGVRGCGFGILTVMLPIVASRLAPPGRQGEAIGIYGLAIALPNLLAVPGAVALTSAGHFGWVAVLSASPVLALLLVPAVTRPAAATTLATSTAPAGSDTSAARAATGSTWPALRRIMPVTLVLLTVTLAGGGVLTYLPIERPSGALATVGLLVFGTTSALARWQGGILFDRHGSRVLLPTGVLIAVAGVALIAVGLPTSIDGLVVAGSAVLGLGYGAVQGLSLMVAFALAGPGQQTTASAAWNAAFDAGTALGALAIGALAGTGLGLGAAFGVSAVAIALTVPLAVRSARRTA